MNGNTAVATGGLSVQQVAKMIDDRLAEKDAESHSAKDFTVTVNITCPAYGIEDAHQLVQRLINGGLYGFRIKDVFIGPEEAE